METSEGRYSVRDVPLHSGGKRSTIVLYSPDLDFCVCLRMLFQGQYNMITITDPAMLLMTVRDFKADIVIVDNVLTERMMGRLQIMRRENPRICIVSFYVSCFFDRRNYEVIRHFVDIAFSKPLDLADVEQSIHEAVTRMPERVNA